MHSNRRGVGSEPEDDADRSIAQRSIAQRSIADRSIAQSILFPFRYWNWKTASITAVIRGSVFLGALGRHAGQKGALIEIAYVIGTSGFFSAIQQGLLGVRNRWLGNLAIVAGVPVAALLLDCLAHLAAATPNPSKVTIGVLIFSLISAAFHLHMMNSGAMLAGKNEQSFLEDLKAVPALTISFVCAPLRWATQLLSAVPRAVDWEPESAD
ncbi:hypothetical protein ACPOL_2084 [Acidisarcina polymorpha]|uniref:Uncharacterized protein n=1 Tax=Acidisarcina polymorpha TaxID=2211140 RepID=A0A2Z5FYG6_9BACT|nr:hypothetical protein [Acidisarcina polymorpha]AXC11416.1 hypothetical protein ACPOL_2084 [Acidisarcina polymorpha]